MIDEIFTDKIFRFDYGCIFLYPKEISHLEKKCVRHVSYASNKFSNTYQSCVLKRTTKYLVTLPYEGEGRVKLKAGTLRNPSYHFYFSYTTLLDLGIWFLGTP